MEDKLMRSNKFSIFIKQQQLQQKKQAMLVSCDIKLYYFSFKLKNHIKLYVSLIMTGQSSKCYLGYFHCWVQ